MDVTRFTAPLHVRDVQREEGKPSEDGNILKWNVGYFKRGENNHGGILRGPSGCWVSVASLSCQA